MSENLDTRHFLCTSNAAKIDPLLTLKLQSSTLMLEATMHIKKLGAAEIGEMLLLRHEPDNIKDKSAVAVMKETDIVGHVPYNISSMLSHFLRRECNKSFVQVTGNCVNRGAGYGMEVPCTPCTYILYGPQG